jgi:signal transduction histidine kinase
LSARVQVTGDDEFSELTEAFNLMAKKLDELNRLKSEFLSTVSHELRTPLTSVLGYLELVRDLDPAPEERQRYLDIAVEKTEVLAAMIEELLDLSRLERGRLLPLALDSFDLNAALLRKVEEYRRDAPRHRFVYAGEDNLMIHADRLRIERVVDNLLNNAVKYSPGSGLVDVALTRGDGVVRVAVRDEGIGMTAEQVEQAFDEFYRADVKDTAISGVGLGLSIARSIVRQHGGAIDLQSRLGVGTTVTFTLPDE